MRSSPGRSPNRSSFSSRVLLMNPDPPTLSRLAVPSASVRSARRGPGADRGPHPAVSLALAPPPVPAPTPAARSFAQLRQPLPQQLGPLGQLPLLLPLPLHDAGGRLADEVFVGQAGADPGQLLLRLGQLFLQPGDFLLDVHQ